MNIKLPTETKPVSDVLPAGYQDTIADPVKGFEGKNTDQKTYSLTDSASISNTVKGDKTKAPVYSGSSTVA